MELTNVKQNYIKTIKMNDLREYKNIEAFNAEIAVWSNNVLSQMRQNALYLRGMDKHSAIKKLSRTSSGKFADKVKAAIAMNLHKSLYKNRLDRSIFRLGFGFPQHGAFITKGVYGKIKGMKRNAKNNPSINSPRQPIDWFNPVIDAHLNELADIVARYNADAIVNSTNILIN